LGFGVTKSSAPLVTFALFAYNQERYVGAAIKAALAQTYSPLEIILSDDCSTDQTFEIMQLASREYSGPHRIILNRNAKNYNLGGHINAVAKLAAGDLIVLAAGDDISVPERTQELVQHWTALGCPTALLCSALETIDNDSRPIDLPIFSSYSGPFLIGKMARGDISGLGASAAVSKSVFSAFSPLQPTVTHEDRVLPFRALLLGGTVAFVSKKLVRYRIDGEISRKAPKSAYEFLHCHLPNAWSKTLPDAVQRLSDLLSVMPGNPELHKLRKACVTTITDQQSWIALATARGFGIEARLIKWLFKGARPIALCKLYLKLRFIPVFNLYYGQRFKE
jgi:glycosyltransferase involved in cell wall biosynthesis